MELQQIDQFVYWLPPDDWTDRPVLGVVAGQQGTLIVDAGNSVAHARLLLSQLEKAGPASPSYLVLTHWHWDHVFGTAAFSVPAFAHVDTKKKVAELAALDWSDEALEARVASGEEIEFCRDMIEAELPDRTDLCIVPPAIGFTGRLEIDLGGVSCHLIHVGGDHAADSTIVHVPEAGVVFLSDCLSPDIYHQPARYTNARLFPLLDKILACEADLFLFGHHPEPLSRAEITELAAELRLIGSVVERCGNDPAAIVVALHEQFGRPPNEDELQDVAAFLAGLGAAEIS